jgi:hypothetical protein
MAPIACKSSSDCPAPTSVCDSANNVCVECLEIEDCSYKPGTVCSLGACTCPTEGQSFCPAYAKDYESRPARCVDLQTTTLDCGACGHSCYGACVAGACVDPWEPTPLAGAPKPRVRHACVSTGTQFVVWGGDAGGWTNTGGTLDVAANAWKPTSTATAASPRGYATAVWTGTEMIVWGGWDGGPLSTGARYDPTANTWKPLSTIGAPAPRYLHTAVWSGAHMIVWGGYDGTDNLLSGGKYDPAADTWAPTNTGSAPSERREHTAAWNGTRMIVYGGFGFDGVGNAYLADGKAYDPMGDAWEDLPSPGAPAARARHVAAWSGTELILWGGYDGTDFLSSGSVLSDVTGWTPMGGSPPSARQYATGVWVGDPVKRMVVWGGDGPGGKRADGGVFDPVPSTLAWVSGAMPTGPDARTLHCGAAVGARMIVWGGDSVVGVTNTGGVFDPQKM